MGKKTVFGLTFLVSVAVLLSGCGNFFTSAEIKSGSVWEAKQMILPMDSYATKLPITKKIFSVDKEITVSKAYLCFHSDGKVYRKIIGKGKWFFGDKTEVIEVINGGKHYTISRAGKNITIGEKIFSYTLRRGELTLQQGPTIIGVYKLSSEPEFTN